MKTKFEWKALINKMGKRKFYIFIFIMFVTFIFLGIIIYQKGIGTTIFLILETILIDYLKEFYTVLKKVDDEYKIEIKK